MAYRGVGDVVGETHWRWAVLIAMGRSPSTSWRSCACRSAFITDLMERHPCLSFSMMRMMGERRMEAKRRIEALLSRTVESRVADFLLRAAESHGIPESRGRLIGVKFTHQEIANYVGSRVRPSR